MEKLLRGVGPEDLSNPRGGVWPFIAPSEYGLEAGYLGRFAVEHIASADIVTFAGYFGSGRQDGDLALVFRAIEQEDEGAIAKLAARLREVESPLPTDFRSSFEGQKRIYRVLRQRFDNDIEAEFTYLKRCDGRYLVAAATVWASSAGVEREELFGLRRVHAARALGRALLAHGWSELESRAAVIVKYNDMSEALPLDWEERYFGHGKKAVHVARHQTLVLVEVGNPSKKFACFSEMYRQSVKVLKDEAKAKAFYDKRVRELKEKHGLVPATSKDFEDVILRATADEWADFFITADEHEQESRLPIDAVVNTRRSPELFRRALRRLEPGADANVLFRSTATSGFYLARICARILRRAGYSPSTSDALLAAVQKGDAPTARELLVAGSPVSEEVHDAAKEWPRIAKMLLARVG